MIEDKSCFNCQHCYNKQVCILLDDLVNELHFCWMWKKDEG